MSFFDPSEIGYPLPASYLRACGIEPRPYPLPAPYAAADSLPPVPYGAARGDDEPSWSPQLRYYGGELPKPIEGERVDGVPRFEGVMPGCLPACFAVGPAKPGASLGRKEEHPLYTREVVAVSAEMTTELCTFRASGILVDPMMDPLSYHTYLAHHLETAHTCSQVVYSLRDAYLNERSMIPASVTGDAYRRECNKVLHRVLLTFCGKMERNMRSAMKVFKELYVVATDLTPP